MHRVEYQHNQEDPLYREQIRSSLREFAPLMVSKFHDIRATAPQQSLVSAMLDPESVIFSSKGGNEDLFASYTPATVKGAVTPHIDRFGMSCAQVTIGSQEAPAYSRYSGYLECYHPQMDNPKMAEHRAKYNANSPTRALVIPGLYPRGLDLLNPANQFVVDLTFGATPDTTYVSMRGWNRQELQNQNYQYYETGANFESTISYCESSNRTLFYGSCEGDRFDLQVANGVGMNANRALWTTTSVFDSVLGPTDCTVNLVRPIPNFTDMLKLLSTSSYL